MPKVLNVKTDNIGPFDVYIGRPSKWGNPFEIGIDGTREEVIKKYIEYLNSNLELLKNVKTELKGKNLCCFCSPKKCHGDYLLQVANEDDSIEYE